MNTTDAQTIVAIAALAATADGNQTDAEREKIAAAASRLGLGRDDPRWAAGAAPLTVGQLAAALSSDEARLAAYDVAAVVCQVDGPPNAAESVFLSELSKALGAVPGISASNAALGAVSAAATPSGAGPATGDTETLILDQAMLAAACELLPHRLSAMAILPLQLRMVYSIGQRHGLQFDIAQAKELVAVLGIGAAGHMMEGIVRGVLGSLGRGLFGGLLGSATGAAAGVAVTFATSYALGHAAEQYYAQGRKLSTADLKTLFARLQGEAGTVFPRVEGRVRDLAAGTNLNAILAGIRG